MYSKFYDKSGKVLRSSKIVRTRFWFHRQFNVLFQNSPERIYTEIYIDNVNSVLSFRLPYLFLGLDFIVVRTELNGMQISLNQSQKLVHLIVNWMGRHPSFLSFILVWDRCRSTKLASFCDNCTVGNAD